MGDTGRQPRGDEPLHVLSLIKGLGPGGAEELLVSCALLADPAAFRHEVGYLLPWKDALVSRLSRRDIPVHCLEVHNERDLRWTARLRRLLARGRFDVVHVHSPYVAGPARLTVASLPRRARPRLVSTEHNVWSKFTPATHWLNRVTYGLGDGWLAVSHEVRNSIAPRWRSRVEVVVHGVDVEQISARRADRDAVRVELGLEPDEIAVVTVANLRDQKGYPDLLRAARRVVDHDSRVRFFAIGQGPLESELRALHAALGLGDRFTFLGYRPDAPRVAAGCDLFCLASRYEGYPVALMEALVLGLPVVATAVGGVPDAIEDGVHGRLVPPSRFDLLAAAIERLVGDRPARERMGMAAAARGEDFDLRPAARRIEALYHSLVDARERTPNRRAGG
ncbi:MAG: glycosyltransferase [Acidimicrobiales bacterium]